MSEGIAIRTLGSSNHPSPINRKTSFSPAYGTEVVTPLEVDLPTLRTMQVKAGENSEVLEEALDFADEKK